MLNRRLKGYLLAELLVVIVIMAFLALMYLPKYPRIDFKDYDFMNDYLLSQSEAMSGRSRVDFISDDLFSPFPIYFSSSGNVNQAQTISANHDIIIHLGNGYLTYED